LSFPLRQPLNDFRWQSAGRLWELLQELQSWDGPPPAKHVPKKPADPVVHADFTPIDMCPMQKKAMEEARAKEISMFTAEPKNTPQISDTSSTVFSPILDELSPLPRQSQQPQPTMDLWSGMPLSSDPITAEQAGMSIEQLLAATAEYDNATGLAQSVDHWSDTTGLANMMVDDALVSMWGAAPATFG
jgi:hypothetical protein